MVDFDFYNDACYHLGLDELEHADSLEYCLNLGGNLATITSPEEQVDIEDYLCEYIFLYEGDIRICLRVLVAG